jgi:hypothetical protein
MRTVVVEVDDTSVVEVYQDPSTLVVATQTAPDVVEISKTEAVVAVDQPPPQIVEVTQQPSIAVVMEQAAPQIVEIVARGPQGPPGDILNGNASSILMYPVQMVDGQPDDLLSFTGSAWVNKSQQKVTDGGNF